MTLPAAEILRAVVKAVPDVKPHLSIKALLLLHRDGVKASGDVAEIGAAYHDAITEALISYFEGGSVTGPRNQFKRAMVEAFGSTFDLAWTDAGGEMPPEPEALSWLNARVEEEFANIESLFDDAKELRKVEDFDFFAYATARADGYTRTLSSIYTQGAALVKDNVMVTWHLGATEKHCKTCAKLDGQRHKIKWFIDRGYIPKQPGASMDCGGYNCDCTLTDDKGNEFTA